MGGRWSVSARGTSATCPSPRPSQHSLTLRRTAHCYRTAGSRRTSGSWTKPYGCLGRRLRCERCRERQASEQRPSRRISKNCGPDDVQNLAALRCPAASEYAYSRTVKSSQSFNGPRLRVCPARSHCFALFSHRVFPKLHNIILYAYPETSSNTVVGKEAGSAHRAHPGAASGD